jgi:hypothetical protein
MGEVTSMPLSIYLSLSLYIYIYTVFFSNVGELNPGPCTCWADTLQLSYVLSLKYLFLFFWLYWDVNSGLYACKAGTLLLEPHHQYLYHSDFQCGSAKGTACAPVGIGTFIPSSLGVTGIGAHCKW